MGASSSDRADCIVPVRRLGMQLVASIRQRKHAVRHNAGALILVLKARQHEPAWEGRLA
jgi:hypothetical protein